MKSKNVSENQCQIATYYAYWNEQLVKHLVEQGFEDIEILKEFDSNLPLDSSGLCLYHSPDIKWKTNMDFSIRLQQLWAICQCINDGLIRLASKTNFQNIDLRESIFIGEAIYSGTNTKRYIKFPEVVWKSYVNIIFHRSIFKDQFLISHSEYVDVDLDFKWCIFEELAQINESKISRISFDEAKFKAGKQIRKTTFDGIYEGSGMLVEGMMDILSSTFNRDVFFIETAFQLDSFAIDNTVFAARTDFSESIFLGDVDFRCSTFLHEVRFINTVFDEPVSFFDLTIEDVMFLHATDSTKKLFNNLVYFNIAEENLLGTISFEQVNFMNILEKDRSKLIDLSRNNKIVIGNGCIKYRLQSQDKVIFLDQEKRNLVIEFAHAFASYFNGTNGINLGVEIKHQDAEKVIFFYFSDENMSQAAFESILLENEDDFLDLLFVKPEQAHTQLNSFPILDAYASLIGLFIKIAPRINAGIWTRDDTDSLLSVLRYSQSPLLNTTIMHKLIVEKFRLPQIVNNFQFKKHSVVKINKPTFIGGSHQFSDKINNFNLTPNETDFWHTISQEKLSNKDIIQLKELFLSLTQDNNRNVDKYNAISHIINILTKQLNTDLPDELYNTLLRDADGRDVRFDAFLSFAEEDAAIAEKIYSELTKRGLHVWFSRVHLKYSQSILGIIGKVIQKSDSGIVILSTSTFSNDQHFPMEELKVLQNQKMYRNMILFPVYHGISHDYILDNYAMLADLYACNTNQGIDIISERIITELKMHQQKTDK